MEQRSPLQRNTLVFISMLFVVLLIVDRYYWAQISQWREDQATNLWLGYTSGIGHIPVGLISSRYIPNPNGMIILGFFLSALPNLISVSFVLGFTQVFFVLLVGWQSFGKNWRYFLLVCLPPLTSVILGSTSVEFWNQYTVTLVNIFFIFWALRYLEKPSLWNLPPIVISVLLAPSLYLAGAVNAIVMTVIMLGIMFYRRPMKSGIWLVLTAIVMLVGISVFITWLPYFRSISLRQIADLNKREFGPVLLLKSLWDSVFGIPSYVTFQWADKSIFPLAFKHGDERILSHTSQILLRLVARAYLLQAFFAFATFSYLMLRILLRSRFKTDLVSTINSRPLRLVVLSTLFISLSFAISAWLGGPNWIYGERPDQTVQFLPIFLFLVFLLPEIVTGNDIVQNVIHGISILLLSIFAVVNMLCGFTIIHDQLAYRGKILTEADVPLINKMQVVAFIANDWKQHSSSAIVPVDYDVARGVWKDIAVTKPAVQLERWYPAALSEGREFDYELLRSYGLRNVQEGIQERTFGSGRYLVTYAFEPAPQIEKGKITNYIFGRLRVSVVNQ